MEVVARLLNRSKCLSRLEEPPAESIDNIGLKIMVERLSPVEIIMRLVRSILLFIIIVPDQK